MAPRRKAPTGKWATWRQKMSNFDVAALFQRAQPPRTARTVYVRQPLPDDYFNVKKKNGKKTVKREHVYATNQVITSKYTILTFLPRNLLEQFRRVANVFFLAIDILQFFPKFATISPGLVILPLLVILALTAAKDGYEDVKRHEADRQVNHSETQIVSNGDYENPNQMANKSRTFTPGIPGKLIPRKKRARAGEEGAAAAAVDGERAEKGDSRAIAFDSVEQPPSIRVEVAPEDSSPSTPAERVDTRTDYDNVDSDSGGPTWKTTLWEDVRVGDVIRLHDNEAVPADIVICATSEPENVAFVETKNLDGETNLKSRHAVPQLTYLTTARAVVDNPGFHIDASAPDVDMYKLNAAVIIGDETNPIDVNSMILRGTILRNTDWVIGIVLYTGADTKIVLNSGATPSKRSRVERQMNPMVIINLLILCVLGLVCGIVDSVLEKRKYPEGAPWLFDDNRGGDNPSINGLITFLNAFITFQNIIPISLYVSIEFVRTAQAAFIYFDPDMVYVKKGQAPEDGKATLARSWNLADDLGQIEYIFSDKTGTLTQNSMEFRQCSIAGVVYEGKPLEDPKPPSDATNSSSDELSAPAYPSDTARSERTAVVPPAADPSVTLPRVELSDGVVTHFSDPQLVADIRNVDGGGADQSYAIDEFFMCLGLCHSVLASTVGGAISYKAQSPDEAALVQAAADTGYIFLGREPSSHILRIQTPHYAEPLRFELLNLLDFTSARKRMSVILRRLGDENGEEGQILLLCKGADNIIFDRLAPREGDAFKEKTAADLDAFANEGLRTLCLASKVISEHEYEEWDAEYRHAQIALEDRDQNVEAVSSKIEQGLRLLGATAIEDKLQDGVPSTIADLKRAGIKIWVATGDKLETAIAIGYSTNLISRQSNLIIVKGGGHRSAYDQMVAAFDQFFPKSGVLERDDVHPHDADASYSRMQERTDGRLKRVNTGISELVGDDNGSRPGGFVLVIDGAALTQAFEEDFREELLLQLSTRCEAVICCRVSPLQKALVVKMVKNGLQVMTLAIGDGANDVSMIQAADVGVGISGEEGLQAVNSSDYAIGQFRFLKRLLLVHGQWTYARNANMIVNFFYKNIVGIGILWWFQIYCAWSTTYIFEYTYLLFWNVFWSLAPVIAIGIFDRNIDDKILMILPELYRYGRNQIWFGTWPFTIYMLDGVYQSAVVFFLLIYSYWTTTTRKDGYDTYIYEGSTVMAISSVMVLNAFHGLSTSAWTWWVWFSVSIGVILIWIYTAVYSVIKPSWFAVPVYGNDHYLFQSAFFWFGILLTFVVAMLPRYIAKAYRIHYMPNDIDILRIVHKRQPYRDLTTDPLAGGRFTDDGLLKPLETLDKVQTRRRREEDELYAMEQRPSLPLTHPLATIGSRTDMSTGLPVTDRGFDFSTEEGGVAIRRIQTNLSERNQDLGRLKGTRRRASRLIPSSLRRSLIRPRSRSVRASSTFVDPSSSTS